MEDTFVVSIEEPRISLALGPWPEALLSLDRAIAVKKVVAFCRGSLVGALEVSSLVREGSGFTWESWKLAVDPLSGTECFNGNPTWEKLRAAGALDPKLN